MQTPMLNSYFVKEDATARFTILAPIYHPHHQPLTKSGLVKTVRKDDTGVFCATNMELTMWKYSVATRTIVGFSFTNHA